MSDTVCLLCENCFQCFDPMRLFWNMSEVIWWFEEVFGGEMNCLAQMHVGE